MTTQLIDTHVHLSDEQYGADLDNVLAQAQACGIVAMIVPASDIATSQLGLDLAVKYANLLPAVGIHAHEADSYSLEAIEQIGQMAAQAVAIGEIGLDYHYNFSAPEQQQLNLRAHLDLAKQCHLPVIIHSRNSDCDMLAILRQSGPLPGGVIHCCTADWEDAKQYLDMGFYLGVTGMVTYPKLVNVHAVARQCPLDRLLTETDGPYLAPVPHRGHRCEPAYTAITAAAIAELRGLDLEDLGQRTTRNAQDLFGPRLQAVVEASSSQTQA